jgi:ribonuclease HIII
VAQKTLVVQVGPEDRGRLKARLETGVFEHRSVPHAEFSVKGEGVVATLYLSGKLVVQGEDPSIFVERFVGGDALVLQSERLQREGSTAETAEDDDRSTVGSDECGKGDFFGPLVVAAVRLDPRQSRGVRDAGVRDSKMLSDESALRLGGALRSTVPYAIARLDPEEYNRTHQRPGHLNAMLADLHARAIREVQRPGVRVVIDQFGPESLMRERLRGLDIALEQRPRAEVVPAVAAASLIAREEFLTALRELSGRYAVDLHKGAGEPADVAARKFVELHGRDALVHVAKIHFKNSARV